MDEVYLTRAGYQKLYDQLEELKEDRVRISRVIEEARLQGDLSENAEYDAAKNEQGHIAARLADIEGKLAKVRIIEDENIPSDKVYIGAIVTIQDLEEDEKIQYMLVSPEEASFEENKLSIFSPVGKGLMGRSVNEECLIKVPAGELKYKVLKIERPS